MTLRTIVCLDDLTRSDTWPASELVFDLVRLPIFRASGLNIGRTPHRLHQMNMKAGFSLAGFRQRCEQDGAAVPWQRQHHAVPQAAADYLVNHLPEHPLVLGHAMPPWLLTLLQARDIAYIDLRVSPLRFGSDLIMGLRTNLPEVHTAVHALALSADAVLDESNLMAARLRMHRRSEGRLRLPNNPCIFVGQAEDDPALVGADGQIARATDHADILNRLARTGPMMYLPHPKAGDFARIERESIERVIGQRLPLCEVDTYDLLACDDELMLLGMNAEPLQEAAWFARPAYALCTLPDRPVFDAEGCDAGWLQIASHTLMGERLWAAALQLPVRVGAVQPEARPNLLRELLNDWSGYGTATLRSHAYQREAYALAGGQRQADALRRCEADLATTRQQLSEMGAEVARMAALLERQARHDRQGDMATPPLPEGQALTGANGHRQRRTSNARKATA